MTLILAGMLTGFSLIVAIGPQNVYVLRQGMLRQHVGAVIAVCLLSDIILIVAGTAGVGVLVTAQPILMEVLRWGGGAYLTWYALRCFRSALNPQALRVDGALGKASVIGTTLVLTWLNPHVYLDTVVMLGTLANQHGPDLRWWFTAGVLLASATWFLALGYGAHALADRLARPATWRIFDTLSGLIMLTVAIRLMFG